MLTFTTVDRLLLIVLVLVVGGESQHERSFS